MRQNYKDVELECDHQKEGHDDGYNIIDAEPVSVWETNTINLTLKCNHIGCKSKIKCKADILLYKVTI